MKKIFGLVAVAFIVIVGIFGFKYYHETYQGVEAYAIVPAQVPEKHETKDRDGKVQAGLYSYDYTFNFVTKDGKSEKRTYTLTGENPTPFEPNSYVKVKMSQKRILEGPNKVAEKDIPADVLAKLK